VDQLVGEKNRANVSKNKYMKQKLEKWLKWIEIIHKDAEDLLQSQYIFSQYIEIVKNNPTIQRPEDFHWWVRNNYVSYVAISIRRQVEYKDQDIISLGKLLNELKQNPEIISREWFKSLYKGSIAADWADSDFNRVAGSGDHFDAKIAEKDLSSLILLAEGITKFADRKIAHSSKQPVPIVKFAEVDSFIKEFEEILKKYILLFTAAGFETLRPIYQYDWEIIFTHKWIVE